MTKLFLGILLFAAITSVCLPVTSKADDITSGTGIELITFCNQRNYEDNNSKWLGCLEFVQGFGYGYELGYERGYVR